MSMPSDAVQWCCSLLRSAGVFVAICIPFGKRGHVFVLMLRWASNRPTARLQCRRRRRFSTYPWCRSQVVPAISYCCNLPAAKKCQVSSYLLKNSYASHDQRFIIGRNSNQQHSFLRLKFCYVNRRPSLFHWGLFAASVCHYWACCWSSVRQGRSISVYTMHSTSAEYRGDNANAYFSYLMTWQWLVVGQISQTSFPDKSEINLPTPGG